MELKYLDYMIAKPLIEEGDVLLFRGLGPISWLITRGGEGLHSHVAVASWHNNVLECVEFREWKGGHTTSLIRQVKSHNGTIDVYRPIPRHTTMVFNVDTKTISHRTHKFNGPQVTRSMRKMTGLPYGWKRIWWLFKHKMTFLRFFYDMEDITTDSGEIVFPVCSTAVAAAFSNIKYDLVHNRADKWTEPSDIARSPFLNYLFTLTLDETHDIGLL